MNEVDVYDGDEFLCTATAYEGLTPAEKRDIVDAAIDSFLTSRQNAR